MVARDQYLAVLDERMGRRGFETMAPSGSEVQADRVFHKRELSLTKFGVLDTFCLISLVEAALTPASAEAYSRAGFAFALRHKIWLPRGLGGTAVAFAVLVAPTASQEVRQFVAQYCPRHWASFEFPVVVESASGEVLSYRSTPLWGAAYYAGFREQAAELFSPAR